MFVERLPSHPISALSGPPLLRAPGESKGDTGRRCLAEAAHMAQAPENGRLGLKVVNGPFGALPQIAVVTQWRSQPSAVLRCLAMAQ